MSANTFLTQIGFSSPERTKALTKMSEAASCWIWEIRGRKRSLKRRECGLVGEEMARIRKMTWNANKCSLRHMSAAGERNFQWRWPLQRNYNAQFSLYGVDVQRSPSLVDNHIMGAVDVDVVVVGLSRVITDRDTRLINGCGPSPENVRSLGRNVTLMIPCRCAPW